MHIKQPRKGHSIWLPTDLNVLVQSRAESLGLSYNNIVIDALHKYFNLDKDPMSALMQEVRMWILREHNRNDFPEDIILLTFQHIQKTPELMSRYNQILEESGRSRASAQATLNRRIGQTITQILNGRVAKRKAKAKDCGLIKGYSKLEPYQPQ